MSSTADVLWMSVVCGMRGVGGVCEMSVFVSGGIRGDGGEWMRGLGFTNPVGHGGVLVVCLCLVCGGVGRGLGLGSGGVGCCYICVSPDSLCRWKVQVAVYCA